MTTERDGESKYQKRRRKNSQRTQQILCVACSVVLLLGSLAFAAQTLLHRFQTTQQFNASEQIERSRLILHQRRNPISDAADSFRSKMHLKSANRNGQPAAAIGGGKDLDLAQELAQLDADIRSNHHGGVRWIRPMLLKELPGRPANPILSEGFFRGRKRRHGGGRAGVFSAQRAHDGPMVWETEMKQIRGDRLHGPKVDYTKLDYAYPPVLTEVPTTGYPQLDKLGDILKRYPQDDLDHPPQPFVEKLLHFNYSNPTERAAAERFRSAELPFKVYDVPDIPTALWTDEYVAKQFDRSFLRAPRSQGTAQESPNNFFAFFTPEGWIPEEMGPPPTRNNDWTYQTWADHAKYADHVGLDFDQPHFYWQAGVPKTERHQPPADWTFISRDLPMLSSPTATFFVFEPDEQKGIQCRFGERGVTAATHYDSGRNMVAMITGAKRYILSPPRECSKLGIVTTRGNSIFRHSLLNFGNMKYLGEDEGVSEEERGWLELASQSEAIDTILKAGEVLYIPSHWFHYITSVQKSAQCNVRSGLEEEGTKEFGGLEDVRKCGEFISKD
jgi:hypothetical protein